jgi:hypothetical protein
MIMHAAGTTAKCKKLMIAGAPTVSRQREKKTLAKAITTNVEFSRIVALLGVILSVSIILFSVFYLFINGVSFSAEFQILLRLELFLK